MTIKQYFALHPIKDSESYGAYARRILEIANADGKKTNFDVVRKEHRRVRQSFETTKQTLKHGEVVYETQKLVEPLTEVPENFRIKRISTNVNTQQQWVIAEPEKSDNPEISIADIQEAIKTISIDKVSVPEVKHDSDTIMRVIYTDTHVAMETNLTGFGLYGGVWNETELANRLEKIVSIVATKCKEKKYKEIHLIDLGDFMDGWDGLTVRRAHPLPQNMDNKKAFKVGLEFKVKLFSSIYEATGIKVVSHNITNSNHSNDFDYIVNHSANEILNAKYGNVEYYTYRRFINHYIIGKHCFILSHGKDSHNLKFGFKPLIDALGKEKITEYIKHHNLQDYFCTFEKGDTHLRLMDSMTFDCCDYNNYMALSPASEWVQTNFKKGRSGFEIMEVSENENIKTLTPYYFGWERTELSKFGY